MTLQIRLLGGLTTFGADGALLTGQIYRRAELLLAYLAEERRVQSRESVATLFWDDGTQQRALSDLRTLLTRLGPLADRYLLVTRHTLAPGPDIALDTDALQTLPTAGGPLPAWCGDFLDGVALGNSRALEEWVLLRREQYRKRIVDGWWRQALASLAAQAYAQARASAEQICALEPLREDAQRLVIRLLLREGQPNAALARYYQLERLLAAELRVPPAAATRDLLPHIHAARGVTPTDDPPVCSCACRATIDDAWDRLTPEQQQALAALADRFAACNPPADRL